MRKKIAMLGLVALLFSSFGYFTPPTAQANGNLLDNGGFELPLVIAGQGWDIFRDGTPGLDWKVEWYSSEESYSGTDRPDPAFLELHKSGVIAGVAAVGDTAQYAELDTDWDGPGNPLNGEPASVVISQEVETCLEGEYELGMYLRKRTADDAIKVFWNGEMVYESNAAITSGAWTKVTAVVYGQAGLSELAIAETGTPDSLGMLIDEVSLVQVGECPDICYAEGEISEPRYAEAVVDYEQGLRQNGTPVRTERSTPEQGLVYEAAKAESSFFSLGFGGWIIVEFADPIFNGSGPDLKITEDTWGGPYPLEKADVYVSKFGNAWTFVGTADNTNLDVIHTTSEFDIILKWAKYVKIVDVTDPAAFAAIPEGDGYDLNAVEALYVAEPCAPALTVDKGVSGYTDPVEIPEGTTVTYTYAVTNTGNVDLSEVDISDDKCSPLSLPAGDDGDGLLNVGEVWTYSCDATLFETTTNTATATGTDEFGNVSEPAQDTQLVTVNVAGCTLTQGYWKTHSGKGPAPYDDTWALIGEDTNFFLSGKTYYQVLWTAPKGGNPYYILAHQWIAATLNVKDGDAIPADVKKALDDSAAYFNTPGKTPDYVVGLKGKSGQAERQMLLAWAGILGGYNEGLTGPGHCSEYQEE